MSRWAAYPTRMTDEKWQKQQEKKQKREDRMWKALAMIPGWIGMILSLVLWATR